LKIILFIQVAIPVSVRLLLLEHMFALLRRSYLVSSCYNHRF